jgi:hypothetical protein
MRNWLPVLIVALLMILWIGLSFFLIGNRPRHWDYGSTPYIPAESAFTTQEPALGTANVPRQIPEIPQPPAGGKTP